MCLMLRFLVIRHSFHPVSCTSIHGGEKWVPKTGWAKPNGDNPRWIWHVLLSPNSCTDNNIDVLRDERDTPTRQLANPQHSRQHHMPSNGCNPWQCELRAECDSQHAATKPQVPFRRAQFKAGCGPWALQLTLILFCCEEF